jgi:hypothetical protein
MPLQETSGNVTTDAYGGGAAVIPYYIEDMFSTWLYTGTSAAQTITNNIDLSTKGGLVWIKDRNVTNSNMLFDTVRGVNNYISSDSITYQNGTYGAFSNLLTAFGTTGFSLGADGSTAVNSNTNSDKYVSWTFRKQPKFFDVVTYTGNSTAGRTVAHNLGSVPGCIIIKRTNTNSAWAVYHSSLANTEYLVLNDTAAKATGTTWWNSTTPTSSVFSLGTNATVNESGSTYVAYVFASNSGGFGLTGTDNVISCGSYTKDGSGNATVTLGYEPQWIIAKPTSTTGRWYMYDTMRGMSMTAGALLSANFSNAESSYLVFNPTATGFKDVMGSDAGETYIYIAIRRGPMKVPTSGTSVFSPQIYTEILTNPTTLTTSFPTDLHMISRRTGTTTFYVADRLRGSVPSNENFLETSSTAAETDYASSPPLFTSNTGVVITTLFNNINTQKDVSYQFRRAPSFFDEVCYTGTGSATTFSHNLGAVPELMIVKIRSNASNWYVYAAPLGNTKDLYLDDDAQASTNGFWNNTTPTSSVFSVSGNTSISSYTYVAYLFATCAGVSKVGSYTGNGSTQTINCGFGAGGARFVIIKRTDAIGSWYVYDTARGMTTLTDPYLLLNSTAAETATLGSVTTVSTGFALNSAILAAINVSAGTYIFLAIA